MTRHPICALLLGLVACGGEPAIGSSDSDIVDGDLASRYAYAALVDAELEGGVGHCSGAVIAPRVALTAGHCVHGFGPWRVTTPFAGGQVVTASRGETFDWLTTPDDPRPDMHDIGLLYLDEPITLDAYPELARDGRAEGSKVRYVGRIDDGEISHNALFVGDAVRAHDGADVGWPFTFRTTHYVEKGDSGGPVVLSKDRMVIVGVDSGGDAAADVELFARVDLLHHWIAERVE